MGRGDRLWAEGTVYGPVRPFMQRRAAPLPPGWALFERKGGKGFYRCPFVQRNPWTHQLEQCAYIARRDRINFQHQHTFRAKGCVPVVIEEEEHDVRQHDSNEQFRKDLQRAVGKFVARESVSAAVGCSASMREFIIRIICVSHQFFTSNHVFNPEQIISTILPRDMKEQIKELGDRVFGTVLDKLAAYKFVNIMIDAGSMLNKGYVHITISNPYSSDNPLPFDIYTKDGPNDWNRCDYLEALESQITRLLSLSRPLTPVAICHDRLLAQSMAVERLVHNLANRESARLPVIDCPCMNHLLNCAFIHAKKMWEFSSLVTKVTKLATTLRKRPAVSVLKRRCPYPPETRWLYICDTLAFLYRYRDGIITYFLQTKPEATVESVKRDYLLPIFHELYVILLPLHELSLCFEQRVCRLADVIPLLELAFDLLRIVSSKVSDEALPILFNLVLEMRILFQLHIPEEAWGSWAMTKNGRSFLRMRNQPPGMCVQADGESPPLCDNELLSKLKGRVMTVLEKFERDKIDQAGCQDDLGVDSTSEEGTDDEFCPDDCFDDETSDGSYEISTGCRELSSDGEHSPDVEADDCFPMRSDDEDARDRREMSEEQKLRDSLASLPLDVLLDSSFSENTYARALSTLRNYYEILTGNICGQHDDVCMRLFDQWLGFTDTPFSQWCSEMTRQNIGDLQIWQHIFKHDDVRIIADIAIRLISAAVGESDVERLFSVQRRLLGTTMTNIGRDVLVARLRISTASPQTMASIS